MIDYCRQDLILGKNFSKKNENKKLAIIGQGGVGSQIFHALKKQGLKNITIFDFDVLELSDFHRHAYAKIEDIGKYKTEIAKEYGVKKIFQRKLKKNDLKNFELVFDATDNLEVRKLINEESLKHGFSWIFSSGVGESFQNSFFKPKKNNPCFECLFFNKKEGDSCAKVGVLNQTVWLTALISVNQGINYLNNNKKNLLIGKLLNASLNPLNFDILKYEKNKKCEVC